MHATCSGVTTAVTGFGGWADLSSSRVPSGRKGSHGGGVCALLGSFGVGIELASQLGPAAGEGYTRIRCGRARRRRAHRGDGAAAPRSPMALHITSSYPLRLALRALHKMPQRPTFRH